MTPNPWHLPPDHPDAAGKDGAHALRVAFGEAWDAGYRAALAAAADEPQPGWRIAYGSPEDADWCPPGGPHTCEETA